jgi:hypothetical protein
MPKRINADPVNVTVTIANNANESELIDCRKNQLLGFYAPASMTGSTWGLKGSHDGTNFFNVNDEGTAYSGKTLTSSELHAIKANVAATIQYAKITTGSNQSGAKSLVCVLRPIA